MNQATFLYIFNLSILIGFVIPLLNLLSGWISGLFGGGADVDAGMDTGFDSSADIGLDAGLDAAVDINSDISIDLDPGLDFDLDLDPGLDMDFGPDAGLDADMHTGAEAAAAGGTAGKAAASHANGPIPFNLMCLCLFLVVFGALGRMLLRFMTFFLISAFLLFICLAIAAFFYWALYTFLIKRLKENDASALSYRELRGMGGELTLGITGDAIGVISLKDKTGVVISFRAKIDPHLKNLMPETIPKGEPVVVTEVDMENKICYVSVYQHKLMAKKREG
ncbi:MAG: hypothetical protein FWH28_05405 [Clostridiales bacterium]|nr:hypothetical protein [Clostridiales bacterium]